MKRQYALPPSTLLIALICAVLTILTWAWVSRPYTAPDWPTSVQGMAYSPYQLGQDAMRGDMPTLAQIDADLAMLAIKTHAIRTYTSEGIFSEIPQLAARHDLKLTLGAWLDNRLERNTAELQRTIKLAQNPAVSHVIIGNEVLLRGELSVQAMATYLDQARAAIEQPVSTAETWSTWVQHPELAEHVDFIAVHILPYWEGIDVGAAISFSAERVAHLQQRFPNKPIVVAEVGWPSEGRTRDQAETSAARQAWFLRHFLQLAEQQGYDYFLMEAFDQPWKQANEGTVGAYWGIYDVERAAKFAFTGPIAQVPALQPLLSVSITLAALLLLVCYRHSRTLNNRGKAVFAGIVYTLVSLVAWLGYDYVTQYIGLGGILTGAILLLFMLGMVVLLLSEAHEWIEAHWVHHRQRHFKLEEQFNGDYPRVSIHVPVYNEPAEMLLQTLNALSMLDYPNYEVIVVDNNTRDEAVWYPVLEHCQKLGERFRFFHEDILAGYKAGALNYALQRTSPSATIIAVIDSDYVVNRQWLRELVPAFKAPEIAIVQAPQDYRDGYDSAFKTMCDAEYEGFFHIGMVTRNDRNAIIQHGTMTLIRRQALQKVGGWAEWCITEDAELGLRILEQGYEAVYTEKSYGCGLIPDTFGDYKKQRYRWAYGAMQILKRHARELFVPGKTRLTAGQRYHFIAGWLPWLAQSLNLVFSMLAIAWSVGMMYAPDVIEAPHLAFSLFPILFFGFNLVKLTHLYRYRIGSNPGRTLAAAIASLSLSHTIGKAMLYGLFTSDQPFIRTPKKASPHGLSIACASAFEEILLFATFILAALTLNAMPRVGSPDFNLWLVLLTIQSIPYGASLFTSIISAWSLPARLFGARGEDSKPLNANPNEQ